MRALHKRNLWLGERDLVCRRHWTHKAGSGLVAVFTPVGRFAPRAGLVTLRQTFVRCRHGVTITSAGRVHDVLAMQLGPENPPITAQFKQGLVHSPHHEGAQSGSWNVDTVAVVLERKDTLSNDVIEPALTECDFGRVRLPLCQAFPSRLIDGVLNGHNHRVPERDVLCDGSHPRDRSSPF
jgi:hypothetical protein